LNIKPAKSAINIGGELALCMLNMFLGLSIKGYLLLAGTKLVFR